MPTSKTAKAPETTPAKGDKKLSTFLCFAIYSANLAFGRAYKPLLDKARGAFPRPIAPRA